MASEEIKSRVKELLLPILKDKGVELIELNYLKKGGQQSLQVYVDKPKGGISMDECVAINEALSEKLDNLYPDPFPDNYMLEVASPGLERPLKTPKEVKEAIGDFVHVSLYKKLNERKFFEGELLASNDSELSLKWNDKGQFKTIVIPNSLIASIRLAVKF